MGERLEIEVEAFSSAPLRLQRTGLLGWMTVLVGGSLIVDGVALRRTRAGKLVCSFPRKGDHAIVRPLNDRARRELEAAILAQLRTGSHEEAPR